MKRTQTLRSKPTRQTLPRKRAHLKPDELLAELERAGLVRRLDESEPGYLFKHTLTQETAYQSLLNRTRRDIHLHVAAIYEDLYADRIDEYAALLAHHYAEGGDQAQALLYETRAGDVSTRLYANAEAIEHYTKALDIFRHSSSLSGSGFAHGSQKDLYLKRGRVFELIGSYDQALENYNEMQTLARQESDRAMDLAALLAIATMLSVPTSKYNPRLAKELSDRALAIAREIQDRGAQAHILRNLMLIARWTQDPADAARYGEQSLAIARECNLRQEMAFTLNDLAVHGYLDAGELQKALAAGQEAGQLWQELNNLPMLADSLSSTALAHYALGHFDDVIAVTDESLKISEMIGNLWGQSYARWIVGNVYSDRGEPEHAVQVMEECIRLGERAGFAGAEVGVRNMLAIVCADCGLVARAVEIAQKSAAIAEPRFAAWAPWSHNVLARLYARLGKIDEAEAALGRAKSSPIEYHIGRGMAQISLQQILAEAEIALAKNDPAYSTSAFDTIINYLRQTGGRALLPEALYVKSQVELARDQDDAAQKSLILARQVAESLAARRTLWKIYVALGQIELRHGNENEALALHHHAREMIEYIATHANEEQRTSFLNLPSVRQILQG